MRGGWVAKSLSLAIIIIGFLLIYIFPLGVRPIAIPDESRYGEIPREMLSSGDWIVPRLNGLRYFEKPVLGYWLNGLSIRLFGENAFAIRFPSAMAAGISALLLFVLVKKSTGRYFAGILAAVVLLTCVEFFIVGTFSVLDSMFSMFVTGTMVLFFLAYSQQVRRKKLSLLILTGIFCGLAFLTKGFLAFVILTGAIVPFAVWERRRQNVLRTILVPILFAVLVALPWCIIIYKREPDFWNYFFWTEHIKRFLSSQAQHHKPFWFFVPILIGGAMPWTVLAVVVIKGLCKISLKDSLVRFGICWFLFCFVFFSASEGKLATYILPCFPPLALLITLGLLKYFEAGQTKDFENAARLSAVIAGVVCAALILNQMLRFPAVTLYERQEAWRCSLAIAAVVTWGICSVLAARTADVTRKLILYCLGPALLMGCAPFIIPDILEDKMSPDEVLIKYAAAVEPNTILVADTRTVQAVCWFYKRSDVYCLGDGELEYGLHYSDSRQRLLDIQKFKELVKSSERGKIILILSDREYAKWRKLIPEPTFIDIDADSAIVFAQFKPTPDKKMGCLRRQTLPVWAGRS
jgi:4-amino-4-deoxy-L-arabinose transferase